MFEQFNAIVIGKGMMGAAAARHLAGKLDGVALVGPDEPAVRADHHDVFASHYDEGRIYRVLEPRPLWARLALHSIERYAAIEAESGVPFHDEVGFLVVGTPEHGIDDYEQTAGSLGATSERLDGVALAARF